MTEFAALKPNTYSYLTDDSDENKKEKGTKMGSVEATHLENKIKNLDKNKFDVVSL